MATQITGLEIVRKAFGILNVFMPGESIPDNDAEYARDTLNDWIESNGLRTLLSPFVSRERFSLVADQGGPDSPYTIGPGGDFDTERPSSQGSITAANLILTATSPEVRVPLGIYTDQGYDANQIPAMSNSQPTGLYYNPTYDGDLGSIFLWPVPDVATNDLELFLQKNVATFADLSTLWIPDGYALAFKYNLADMLQVDYGRTLPAKASQIAVNSLGVIKRANLRLSDQANDASLAIGSSRHTLYNIQTGSGG